MSSVVEFTPTALALLPPAQRAKVALASETRTPALKALAQQSVEIVRITNPDGYRQCHAARMALKNARVEVEKVGKTAREDARDFQQAVIAEERTLVALIEPEEKRLQALQDAEDARIAEAKEARAKAERERLAKITQRIDWIRGQVVELAGKTGEEIEAGMATIAGLPLSEELYAERLDEAREAAAATMTKLAAMAGQAIANAKEKARLAEEQRQIDARRAELDRQEEARKAQQKQEDDARAARQREEDEARAYAIAWEDAHREYHQRIVDQTRAELLRADEAARAFAQAWDDAHAEDARRGEEAKQAAERVQRAHEDRLAAEQRQRERTELEGKADPWAALTTIRALVASREGAALPAEEVIAQVQVVAFDVLRAKMDLAALDRDGAELRDATEGRR